LLIDDFVCLIKINLVDMQELFGPIEEQTCLLAEQVKYIDSQCRQFEVTDQVTYIDIVYPAIGERGLTIEC
jgi:hypothetical protein